MREALILGAVRSPFGARHGLLADRHPAELLGATFAGLLERCGLESDDIDEVLVGCATPVGAQAGDLAAAALRYSERLRRGEGRHAGTRGPDGLAVRASERLGRVEGRNAGTDGPEGLAVRASERLGYVPASVVSTRDTSSLVALVRAVDAVRSGRCEVVLVGGVEVMSTVPAGADMTHRGFGLPLAPPDETRLLAPGPAAERWAAAQGLDRDHLESVAARCRSRAIQAQAARRFAAELVPLPATATSPPLQADELPAAALKPDMPAARSGARLLADELLGPADRVPGTRQRGDAHRSPGADPSGANSHTTGGGAGRAADGVAPADSSGVAGHGAETAAPRSPRRDAAGFGGRDFGAGGGHAGGRLASVDEVGVYSDDGLLTAGMVAPMADGAAAALVAAPAVARRWGIEPLARVVAVASVGGDPQAGCGASPQAAERVLAAGGVPAESVRRVELAEPFATSVVAWELARPGLAEVLNPDGGSLALGHPQGATGLGLVARLVRALGELPGGGHGLCAADAVDGHGVAVLLQA